MEDLFGNVTYKEKEEKKSKEISNQDIITKNNYNVYEVVSALIKEMRLSNFENAFYWAKEMFDSSFEHRKFLAKHLIIFAAEDISPKEMQAYLVLLETGKTILANLATINHVFYAVQVACNAKKFFQQDYNTCLENELIFWETGKTRKEIPSYALDEHTRRGKQIPEDKRDERFSGNRKGRNNMIETYWREGYLSSDTNVTTQQENATKESEK